jgi:hypothetical protein
MNQSIKNIVDAFTKLLAMIFTLFTGDTGEVVSYVTSSLTAAFAAQTADKATPLQIVTQGFALASSISTELNAPKITTVINALQQTESDAVAGKVLPLIPDLIADYKDIKAAV